jgi:hypothetical protein
MLINVLICQKINNLKTNIAEKEDLSYMIIM